MISNADGSVTPLLENFLAYTLRGNRPLNTGSEGICAAGQVQWSWLDDGVLLLEPGTPSASGSIRHVLLSAGIHGDETAPIELLSRMVRSIAVGELRLASRLLVIFGNVDAMRDECRYRDDDLNRLFSGWHGSLPSSHEATRAAALEQFARAFFASVSSSSDDLWHIDMHTAIRASEFEKFALLPHTGKPHTRAMFDWLSNARMDAILLHTTRANTYSNFTAQMCRAMACTLELGKVRPFGQNNLGDFASTDAAVRKLVSGKNDAGDAPMPRVFTVVAQLTKRSEDFELRAASNVSNFTAYQRGTLLARDRDYQYIVQHDEERLVFPNPKVKPGLRAGLLVVDTTEQVKANLV